MEGVGEAEIDAIPSGIGPTTAAALGRLGPVNLSSKVNYAPLQRGFPLVAQLIPAPLSSRGAGLRPGKESSLGTNIATRICQRQRTKSRIANDFAAEPVSRATV
jgi:hypothetical protein